MSDRPSVDNANQPGAAIHRVGDRIEHAVFAADAAVAPTPEAGNEVLVDQSRAVRWAGPAFVVCAAVLVPWTFYLGATLPGRAVSAHYDVAWTGFDIALAALLLVTGYMTLRRSQWLVLTAAASATALVVDAWFDVLTSTGSDVWQAVVLPLAAVCAWLAHHGQDLNERRLRLVIRRHGDADARKGQPAK